MTGKERVNDVAHDVDLDVFVELPLAPQHWVVEEIVVDGMKATVKTDRVADVNDVLTVG